MEATEATKRPESFQLRIPDSETKGRFCIFEKATTQFQVKGFLLTQKKKKNFRMMRSIHAGLERMRKRNTPTSKEEEKSWQPVGSSGN